MRQLIVAKQVDLGDTADAQQQLDNVERDERGDNRQVHAEELRAGFVQLGNRFVDSSMREQNVSDSSADARHLRAKTEMLEHLQRSLETLARSLDVAELDRATPD